MAYINFQPRDFFNTVLYTGTGSSQAITGVGFQPDFTWIKIRNTADAHGLVDSTRGATKHLRSDSTASEFTRATDVSSFDSDGFTVVSDAQFNGSGNTYASWNWKANGGTTSSNTDGSITSTVQANTTSGFSIVTYTGTGASATVGHGLGKTPSVLIIKNRGNTRNWAVWNKSLSSTYADNLLTLNTTDAVGNNSIYWGGGNHTSTTFELNTSTLNNENTYNHVAYCFADIKGYSKFGSYTGNGSTNGTFVYTGFRPAFILTKASSRIEDWAIIDNKRDTYNVNFKFLKPNTSEAENTGVNRCDFTSNGFKWRDLNTKFNQSGETYIYMAFAEFPLVGSNGLAGTAR